jgi:chemotaxis protein MotC
MSRTCRSLAATVVALAACAPSWAAPAVEEHSPLQPYQLVRSLQLLQDRIADGDHAALPMQNKLLEIIDQRFRKAADADFEEPRNVRAALVYGMSGGNPSTLTMVLRKPTVPEADKKLGVGVLAYLKGDVKIAQSAMADVDPTTMPSEIGAFFALVKGSVNVSGDAELALEQFDDARLMGPGTLVEEAALRRSLALEAQLGQTDRFFRAAEQYVRRFLRSPYASQFADSFVSGVIKLHDGLDLGAVDKVAAMMEPDQRKVIYLRLARRATIDGFRELSVFAAERAKADTEEKPQDARGELYSALSNLTSGNVESIATELKSIDRQRLAESDLRLLEAAEAITREVTAKPADLPEPTPSPVEASFSEAATPPATKANAERSADPETPAPAAEVHPEHAKADAPVTTVHDVAPAAPDSADAVVAATRAKLTAIDDMLKDAK